MIVGAMLISHHYDLSMNECPDPWAFGPICNVIEAVCLLPQPVPHRGALSLWKIDEDVRANVQTQLEAAPIMMNNISDLPPPRALEDVFALEDANDVDAIACYMASGEVDKAIAIMEDSAAAEPPNALAPPPDALMSSSHVLVPPLVGAAKAAASTAGDAAPVATKAAIDTAGDAASAAAKAAADTAGDAAPAAESPAPLLDACVPPPGTLVSSSHAFAPPLVGDAKAAADTAGDAAPAAEPSSALAPPPGGLVSSSHALMPPLLGAAKAAPDAKLTVKEEVLNSKNELSPPPEIEVIARDKNELAAAREIEIIARDVLAKHGLPWDLQPTLYCIERPDKLGTASIFVCLEDDASQLSCPTWQIGTSTYTFQGIKRVSLSKSILARVYFSLKIIPGW